MPPPAWGWAQVPECGWLPWKPPASPSSPGWNQRSSLHRKDESKEPIVEVRTEEERTPNHDGGKHTEPNETTPLTEPEYVGPSLAEPHTHHSTLPTPPCLPPAAPGPAFWSPGPGIPDPTLLREEAFVVLSG